MTESRRLWMVLGLLVAGCLVLAGRGVRAAARGAGRGGHGRLRRVRRTTRRFARSRRRRGAVVADAAAEHRSGDHLHGGPGLRPRSLRDRQRHLGSGRAGAAGRRAGRAVRRRRRRVLPALRPVRLQTRSRPTRARSRAGRRARLGVAPRLRGRPRPASDGSCTRRLAARSACGSALSSAGLTAAIGLIGPRATTRIRRMRALSCPLRCSSARRRGRRPPTRTTAGWPSTTRRSCSRKAGPRCSTSSRSSTTTATGRATTTGGTPTSTT